MGSLTLAELERVARGGAPAPLSPEAGARLARGRETVDAMVAAGTVVYGVTTGFGDLSSVRIDAADAAQLQLNLVRSHAIGVGEPLPGEVVRGMLLLLANSLSKGHSGVRPELVALLLALLERDVLPVVPSRGSVGASGDLAPLAHVAVVLCGEGEATFAGERLPGGEALRRAGLAPVELAAKEGLALINGTHLMAACGALALRDARRLLDAAIVTAALSLEAFMGSTTPFDARIHDLRRHPGQNAVAARLRALLQGSAIVASHADCGRVQDPYTLRCVPQVLGAIADAFDYAEAVLERELDAVTDNPLLFPDDGEACSGGNFHGQPLSLALDHLGLALCELASFAERRTYALLSPSYAGLPRFLTPHPGLYVRPDDRPVHAGRARQRVPGARASRRRGLGAHLGRHGGLQLDGRVGRAQGAPDRRSRGARGRDRARLRMPGRRVPPAAALDAAARGRARRGAEPRRAARAGSLALGRGDGARRRAAQRRAGARGVLSERGLTVDSRA